MSCSGLLDSKYQVPTVLYCIIEMLLSEMRDMRDTWQPDNLTTDNIDFLIVTLSSRQSTHFILHRLLICVWSLHNCNKLHNVRFSNLDDAGGEAWSVPLPVVFSLLPGGGEGEKEKAQTQHQHLAVRSHLVTLLSQQAQYDGVMQLSRIEHMLPSTCRYWNTPILIKRRREHF